MKDLEATRQIGRPFDYTDDLYRVYFEVGESDYIARDAITIFLISRNHKDSPCQFSSSSVRNHKYGYEVDIPLQFIPEIVRELSKKNVAIYQVIRINKL